MAFQAAPQCVEIKLVATQNGIPVVNRWNVDVGHAVTPTDLASMTLIFDGWLTGTFKNFIHNSVQFVEWIVTDISVFGGAQQVTPCSTTTGGQTSAPLSAGAAGVISWRTGFAGRNFRGRTYVAGIVQADLVDAQHFTAGYVSALNGAGVNLIAVIQAAGAHLVVLSRYLAKVLRVVALATEITTVITDTVVDSQRRRNAN